MLGGLPQTQLSHRISLCPDAPQTHQLLLQYFLHLQIHPMNSTSVDYGQSQKHMA